MSLLYLYALAAEDPAAIPGASPDASPGTGLAGEPLRAIPCTPGLFALAGEMPERPRLTRAALAAHDETVRRLAALLPALLPARFGETAPDEPALRSRLAPRAQDLIAALALVRGSVQMTLRVFAGTGERAGSRPLTEENVAPVEAAASTAPSGGPQAASPGPSTAKAELSAAMSELTAVLPELLATSSRLSATSPELLATSSRLSATSPELLAASSRLSATSPTAAGLSGSPNLPPALFPQDPAGETGPPAPGPGARYLAERRRLHEQRRSLPEVAALREALRPLLRAERVERHAAGRLLATAYDLVGRDEVEAYRATVERESAHLAGYRVAASGPWPPYAFAPEVAP